MKGLNLSLGFTITSLKGRKDEEDNSNGGPSPIPDELLSGDDQK